jgi:cold shock CspA family protein
MQGRVIRADPVRGFGFIEANGERFFFHRSELVDPSQMPAEGSLVEFETAQSDRGPQAKQVNVVPSDEGRAVVSRAGREHSGHCFVVMPYGREAREIRWHRGWFETVIAPAVVEAGFEPILAATEERPNAINDEIRFAR